MAEELIHYPWPVTVLGQNIDDGTPYIEIQDRCGCTDTLDYDFGHEYHDREDVC